MYSLQNCEELIFCVLQNPAHFPPPVLDSNNSPVEQRHFTFVGDETVSSPSFRQWLSQRGPVLTWNCCQHHHMFHDKREVFRKLALQNRDTVNLCLILKMACRIFKACVVAGALTDQIALLTVLLICLVNLVVIWLIWLDINQNYSEDREY